MRTSQMTASCASVLTACTTGLDARDENDPMAFSACAAKVVDSLPAALSHAYLHPGARHSGKGAGSVPCIVCK